MWSALVMVTAILALNLGNAFVLAQTGDERRWLRSLHMLDAKIGWALSTEGGSGAFSKGAVGSVMRTTDGGLHWKDVTPHAPPGQRFPQGVGDIHALTHLSAWVLAGLVPLTWNGSQEQSSVVFHTVDGGQTWRSVPISVDGFMWLMDFINSSDGWVVSGKLLLDQTPTRWDQFFGVHRSTDGGKTWTKVGSAKVGSAKSPGFAWFISFLNTTTGWIAGTARDGNYARAYLLVTQDGGHIWQQQKLPLPSKLTPPEPGLIPGTPRFLTGQDGILPVLYSTDNDAGILFYVTHDGGTTWTNTTPIALEGLPTGGGAGLDPYYSWWSFADINHGWVTRGNALYLTSDGGRRWTKLQPSLPERPLEEIDFISPQVGWATGPVMQKPFLLKTIDGGRTWTSVTYTILRQ